MSDSTDYYEVLGVDRTATSDEIKRAYRKLARTHHPDINKDPSAEARFKEIGLANEVLSDPGLRARYDAFGADFRHVPDDVDPEEWANAQRMRDRAGQAPPGRQQNVDSEEFQDFFADLLRERRQSDRGWGPMPGADQRAAITLNLNDAFHGGRRSITMAGPSGERTIQVKIPAGVTDGQTIRLPGQGARGTEGAPPGDLYLQVTIEPEAGFRLSGRDIETDLPLSPWEAVLGATVPIVGPGGTTKVKVSPGTSTGKRLRIRGQGLPGPATAGDLYARVQIVVPEQSSPEDRRLYEELAELSDFDPRSG
jgi:curved DNA-binding protein